MWIEASLVDRNNLGKAYKWEVTDEELMGANIISMSKNVSEFENIFSIFVGIVGEPHLSYKNISCFEGCRFE